MEDIKHIVNGWEFHEDARVEPLDDFWDDISSSASDGVKPEHYLEDSKQIEQLKRAIYVVKSFEKAVNIRTEYFKKLFLKN